MDKKSPDDEISLLQKKIDFTEEKFLSDVSDLKKSLAELENRKASKHKDINSILSVYAQNAIQESKGPITPDDLITICINEKFGKKNNEILPNIQRNYKNDIKGVREQLLKVCTEIENNMEHMKRQKQMDERFIKKLKKMDEFISKEIKSKCKQSTLDLYFRAENVPLEDKSQKVKGSSSKNLQKRNASESSTSSSQPILEQRSEKRINKRKLMYGNSGYSEKKKATSEIRKRLKLNSAENSSESESIAKPSYALHEDIEPMILGSDNSQHTEPMSVDDSEGPSTQHIEPMLIVNSERSSSQSDELSEEEPRENVVQKKSISKELGTSSESSESGFKRNASKNRRNKKTVPEKGFYIRKTPLKRKTINYRTRNYTSSDLTESDKDESDSSEKEETVNEINFRNLRGIPFRKK